MLAIISTAALAYFIYYFSTTFGNIFYGNLGDLVFVAVAVPVMFIPSRFKVRNWVRKGRNSYMRFGRVISMILLYCVLVTSMAYIPIAVRTHSTEPLLSDAIRANKELRPIVRLHVMNYAADAAMVCVVTETADGNKKSIVDLTNEKGEWRIASVHKISGGKNVFPPFR